MAVFRNAWTPPNTDPGGTAIDGWLFSASSPISITHIGFYKHASSPPSSVRPALWNPAATGTPLVDVGATDISGAPTGWVDIALASPYSLAASTDCVASVLVATANTVTYASSDLSSPISDGVVTAPAGGGRFHFGSSLVYPDQTWSGMHGVRITYQLAAPNVGQFALGLDLAVAFTGGRPSEGGFALGLDLALAFVGPGSFTVPPTHAGTVTRPSAGTVARPDTGVVTVPRKSYP